MPPPACRLYLITPPRLEDPAAFTVRLEAALSAGDVAAVQVRLKDASEAEITETIRVLGPIIRAHDAALILNDDPALAARLDCDGVHVGQSDAPYAQARRLMGRDRIVGVTCHDSRHLAMEAAEQGADYVAFGAFFDTSTKDAPTRADPEILSVWQETLETPCVAIGGITADTARGLAAAGADFLAVSAGVWSHPAGEAEAVRALNAAIALGLADRTASGAA